MSVANDLELQWRRELERLGANKVRRALTQAGALANVDRDFAKAWLRTQDERLLRRLLWTERVRTIMLAIAALASIILAIQALMEWLL